MKSKKLQILVDDLMSNLPKSILDLGADREYLMPYIQHDPEEVDRVQFEFLEICSEVLKSKFFTGENSLEKAHRQGIVGRILDDSGNTILYSTWYRFMCIDDGYREWCQPYYAINYSHYKIEECSCINDKYPELLSHFRGQKIDSILK